MKKIVFIILVIINFSCINKTNSKEVKTEQKIDSIEKISKIKVNDEAKEQIKESANKSPVPDNFLGFKLGTSISEFKSKHPNIPQQASDFYTLDLSLMGCGIYFDGMDRPYVIDNLETKSGDEVEMSIFFYNNILCAIYVEYKNGLFAVDKVFAAFKDKYGAPSVSKENPDYQNTIIYYWVADNCALNLLYKSNTGDLFLVFADKKVQKDIIKKKKKANAESIE